MNNHTTGCCVAHIYMIVTAADTMDVDCSFEKKSQKQIGRQKERCFCNLSILLNTSLGYTFIVFKRETSPEWNIFIQQVNLTQNILTFYVKPIITKPDDKKRRSRFQAFS